MDETRHDRLARAVGRTAPGGLAAIDHARALLISSRITTSLRKMYKRNAANVQPQEVIKVLKQASVKFVLVGAHGIAGWLDEPRATQDVDVLIQTRYKQAVQAIEKAFPGLTVQDLPAVTRFLDPTDKRPVIDLMRSQAALYKLVAKNVHQVGKSHAIPDLEMALVLKYAAMHAPDRSMKKRLQDRADFIGMVTKNHEIIDEAKLRKLARGIKPGSGEAIMQLLHEARAEEGPPDG
jgi:hypothetical protein